MKTRAIVRIGLIGCGSIAQKHLMYWRNLDRALVSAVCDIDIDKAKETAKQWHIPNFYSDLAEMMAKEAISLVDVCTPPKTHCALVIQALNENRHALVEKPLATTRDEAKRLIETERGGKAKIFPIHNNIFDPVMIKALSLIREGVIGHINNIDVRVLVKPSDTVLRDSDCWRYESPIDHFADILPHPIYTIQATLSSRLEVKSVHAANLDTRSLGNCGELWVELDGGYGFGCIYISLNSVRDACFIDIYGTAGILKIDLVTQTMIELKKRSVNTLYRGTDSLNQALQLLRCTALNGFYRLTGNWKTGHEVIMRRALDTVLGGAKPAVTLDDAYTNVNILEQICNQIRLCG
jgi:predicted dehydrogenase